MVGGLSRVQEWSELSEVMCLSWHAEDWYWDWYW